MPYIGAPTNGVIVTSQLLGNPVTPFDKDESEWSVYLTEDLRFFNDALIVNFGSRLTDDVFFGTYTTSGAGFRYNFGGESGHEPFGLKANWSQSFKAPGLSPRFANTVLGSGRNALGSNPNLVPETGTGYQIGLDVQFSPTALLRILYFRTDIVNSLQNTLTGGSFTVEDPNVFTTVNAQAFLSTGWNISLDWQLSSNWQLTLS